MAHNKLNIHFLQLNFKDLTIKLYKRHWKSNKIPHITGIPANSASHPRYVIAYINVRWDAYAHITTVVFFKLIIFIGQTGVITFKTLCLKRKQTQNLFHDSKMTANGSILLHQNRIHLVHQH